MATTTLQAAKTAKNDEFYTQLSDIERELNHYRDQLRDKVIFCNCDDPYESNFFKYFVMNFNTLEIKKLIATCYSPSPIAGTQLPLLPDIEEKAPKKGRYNMAHKIEISEIFDYDNNGSINLDDVEKMLKNPKYAPTPLKGDGDFRSDECVELLKQADVVITNPPFSLFREYVAQLIEYDKKFVIVGSKNAITYKEIFPLIKNNKMWLGYGFSHGNAYFTIPPEKAREYANGVLDEDKMIVKFRNVGWFTNLFVDKSNDPIVPYIKYEDGLKKGLYPKYDNYDAIEVSKVAEIPVDYYGAMGVPITFLDRYAPSALTERERERERSLQSSVSTDTSRATERRTSECSSTTKKSTRELLSNE
jgi:hypothetical protein